MNTIRVLLLFFCFGTCILSSQADLCESFHEKPGRAAIICGKISVPTNHGNPESIALDLSYVIIPASEPDPTAYPLLFISGGPGGSSLQQESINSWLTSPIHLKRDIILFDQRGIGYSSPLPNIHGELRAIMAKDASEAEEEAMIAGLLKDSAEKWDVQLQYYNSVESAQDLGELMDHLNYVKYNIFGVSYGTRLAREVQDRFPERINTVILDSPNPIKGDFLVDRLLAYSLALERVFAYCGENLECRQDYPNLRERYMNAIKAISRRPITIDDSGSKFVVNSQDAIYFLRRKLYANDSREAIPRMIAEYENGGGPLLEELVKEAFTPDYNYSMWLAVERYEMYNAANTPERIEALYDSLPLLPATLGLFTGAYLAMPMLHESSLPEERKAYAVSEVPTLITVNHFDPVTPPENGHILMRNLAKGKLYILNEGGHGGGDYECLDKFMVEFMDSPDEKPDTSCLNIYVEKKRR